LNFPALVTSTHVYNISTNQLREHLQLTNCYFITLILITHKYLCNKLRNEEVLLRVTEQRNILHKIRKRKANWIGHILRRNCRLQQVIEGKIKGQIEVTRRRGRSYWMTLRTEEDTVNRRRKL